MAESVTGEKAAYVGGGVAPRTGCESKDGGEAPREESSREDIGWPSCEIHGRSCEMKCAAEGQRSAEVADDVASRGEQAQGTSSEMVQGETRPGIGSRLCANQIVALRADKRHEPAKPRPHDITLTSPMKKCGMSIQWRAASHRPKQGRAGRGRANPINSGRRKKKMDAEIG